MGSVDDNNDNYSTVSPMEMGCVIFAGPFFILVGWIILAVIFNWR